MVLSYFVGVAPVGASGVTVTVSPTSSSSSPQSVTVQWSRSVATSYTTGTTITISIASPSVNTSTFSVSSTSAIDLDQNGLPDTLFTSTSTGSQVNISFTVSTTTSANTVFAIPISFTFGATPANYAFSVFTSNPVDFGSALLYTNGGNQVNVTANVPASLSFVIRNAADTADTNSCALGTLSVGSVSSCSYRLRIATNAMSGFSASIVANHDFATGSATMTNIGAGGSFTAGTEAYGIQTLTGATTGGRSASGVFTQPVVEATPFNADASQVPISTPQTFISYVDSSFNAGTSPSLTSTSLVTHAAAINAGTPAGNYSQTITYTVTASF